MNEKREDMMAEARKLLIVDDDPGIRNQLKWGVEGFDIVTAENRESALQQLSRHHPAVVTLDLGMPPDADGSQEGFATLKQILSEAPGTKVIIVSASEDPDNAQKAVDSGAFEYFPKPVDIEQLSTIIERAYLAHKNHS